MILDSTITISFGEVGTSSRMEVLTTSVPGNLLGTATRELFDRAKDIPRPLTISFPSGASFEVEDDTTPEDLLEYLIEGYEESHFDGTHLIEL